jgi:hypothetical protein
MVMVPLRLPLIARVSCSAKKSIFPGLRKAYNVVWRLHPRHESSRGSPAASKPGPQRLTPEASGTGCYPLPEAESAAASHFG